MGEVLGENVLYNLLRERNHFVRHDGCGTFRKHWILLRKLRSEKMVELVA
jgi:hypothetical protein